MPGSFSVFREDTIAYIKAQFPSQDTTILDVGPGAGIYGKLLKPMYPLIEGCEIYEPYVERYELGKLYKTVHIGDIRSFLFDHYDLIIMGGHYRTSFGSGCTRAFETPVFQMQRVYSSCSVSLRARNLGRKHL